MKVTLTNRRKWLIGAGAALLLTATPSFALFGIGDIVFDPTSYTSLVQQLTTLQMQYNMVKNNLTHFSIKQQWQTTLHALENVNVANMFGETAGMRIALNTNSPSASSTAWKAATVTMNGGAPSYLATQSLGSSRTSQLALIKTSDAVSPDCLTAVGQYRSDRSTNATANSSLLSSQFDVSDSTNSEVQQLNLLNAAEAQKTFNGNYSIEMWLANLIPCIMVFVAFIVNMLLLKQISFRCLLFPSLAASGETIVSIDGSDKPRRALLHVHVCVHCSSAFPREKFDGKAVSSGLFLCPKCGVESRLNVEIRESAESEV